jgi:hypothetical protein
MRYQYHVQYGNCSWVSANIFWQWFPRNFVPSFSWVELLDLLPTSQKHLKLQNSNEPPNLTFDEQDAAILEHVFEETKNGEKSRTLPI